MNGRFQLLLLGSVLLGHLVLLSTHEEADENALERGMLQLISPLAHGVVQVKDGVIGFSDSVKLAGQLRVENADLRAENESLRRQLATLHGVEEELERISQASRYKRFETNSVFVADVVYVDDSSWLRTLVLYTGEVRARRNQPVTTAEGLVGRVALATERYAKVLLLNDRASSASAMIKRSRRRGMLRGDGEQLILDNIPMLERVMPGDQVVTAGIDGVFPRGIPLGEVVRVRDGQELFHHIEVKPAVDFAHLDQVYVLKEETVPAAIKEAEPGSEEARVLEAEGG